ncbi:hypothetical protein O3M35_001244 [Rhynocoris fuscipes]|uniref:phospholipase A2 n=1 Tax=Rhynocoris fuscipes TaxID=488301 RepID=A0AAW1DU13_9HEMI
MIRQVTDGKELIQAIYSEGTLVDCDLSNRQSEAIQLEIEINEIMSTTNNSHNININNNNNYKNNSIESLENIYTSSNTSLINSWRKSREDLRWLNISKLTRQCLSTQERAISSLVKSRSRRSLLTIKPSRHGRKNRGKKRRRHDRLAKGNKQGLKQKLIPPGTKWCGPSNRARKFGDLGGFWKADKCCRKHDTCAMYILPFSNKYSKVNTSPFTLSHCSCDHRNGEEVLRLPGTAWCGRGYSASHYRQLGPFTAADRCCRRHDTACPYYIPAMDNRYGLYNWRPSTLMHCSCDRRSVDNKVVFARWFSNLGGQ